MADIHEPASGGANVATNSKRPSDRLSRSLFDTLANGLRGWLKRKKKTLTMFQIISLTSSITGKHGSGAKGQGRNGHLQECRFR